MRAVRQPLAARLVETWAFLHGLFHGDFHFVWMRHGEPHNHALTVAMTGSRVVPADFVMPLACCTTSSSSRICGGLICAGSVDSFF
jgi:hypothetical protein